MAQAASLDLHKKKVGWKTEFQFLIGTSSHRITRDRLSIGNRGKIASDTGTCGFEGRT